MAALPPIIPVFPLGGAVMFPRSTLPLNIFEPRYLAMVRDAMRRDGLIGMIQPRGAGDPPPLFEVGTVGRIAEHQDTPDGRILIELEGLVRFRIVREVAAPTLYRQVEVDYSTFMQDLSEPRPLAPAERAGLEKALAAYLDLRGLSGSWDAIRSADDESLVSTLSVVCPFDPAERQALVEAPDLAARTAMLVTIMSFAPPPETGATLQ